jgi:hypothetical protein
MTDAPSTAAAPSRPRLRPTIRRRSGTHVIVNPADFVSIIGQTFVKSERRPLLTIGNRHWDRWSLGRLGVAHPVAAANVNRVVHTLGITTVAQLATRLQEVGTYIGMGVTAYFVCLAILREAGYQPEAAHGLDVTYNTMKIRAMKQAEKDRPRRRKVTH